MFPVCFSWACVLPECTFWRTCRFWWQAFCSGRLSCSLPRVLQGRLDGRGLSISSLPHCLVTFFPHSWCFVTGLFTRSTCPNLASSMYFPSQTRHAQAP